MGPHLHASLCESLSSTFECLHVQSLSQWSADRAVLPIENSLGGSIHANLDLMLRYRCAPKPVQGIEGRSRCAHQLPHPVLLAIADQRCAPRQQPDEAGGRGQVSAPNMQAQPHFRLDKCQSASIGCTWGCASAKTSSLHARRLHIVAETLVDVNHCLLALPGTRLADLNRVISHPQVGAVTRSSVPCRGALRCYEVAHGMLRMMALSLWQCRLSLHNRCGCFAGGIWQRHQLAVAARAAGS